MNNNKEWLPISYCNDFEPLLTYSLSHSDCSTRLAFFKEYYNEEGCNYLFEEDFLETDAYCQWTDSGDYDNGAYWYFNIHTGEIKQISFVVKTIAFFL